MRRVLRRRAGPLRTAVADTQPATICLGREPDLASNVADTPRRPSGLSSSTWKADAARSPPLLRHQYETNPGRLSPDSLDYLTACPRQIARNYNLVHQNDGDRGAVLLRIAQPLV